MKIKGFTLIEMVVTTIIMGIIFIGVGAIIDVGNRGYIDTIDRQRIQNQARFVVEKLTREVRHAVPNSFNTYTDSLGDKCLSFYPISNAGFYARDEENRTITFIVDNQGSRMSSSNERLAINPSQPSDLSDDSRSASLSGCLASSNSSCLEENLGSSVYSYQIEDDFASHSIAYRYYTYSEITSYCIASSGLISKSVGGESKITVAGGLSFADSQFLYKDATLQRGGLVHMELMFINEDEESFYQHDVQVLNVP